MQDRPAFIGRFFFYLYSSIPPVKKTPYREAQAATEICPWRSFICEALSGFLSGFYFALMFYHPAIKKPFAGVLRALQQHDRYIPAMAAGEGTGKVGGS